MIDTEYVVVASDFNNISDIDKDDDLYYRCKDCGSVIMSIPGDNVGCECGNIFIDRDYWRLVVVDLSKIEVVKKKKLLKGHTKNSF